MRESENMSLQEERIPENHSSMGPDFDHSLSEEAQEFEDMHAHEEQAEFEEEALSMEEGEQEQKSSAGHSKNKPKVSKKDSTSAQFEAFLKQFQSENQLENKLQLAIDFMEKSLAQEGTPHFRNFWEARRLCLPLFKENISPLLRSQLWNKYSELSKEARRLKEILDEQGAFAVEQIEIAIQALENDIEKLDEEAHKHPLPQEAVFPKAFDSKRNAYENIQQQLNVLNAQASRINALRKELLKTDMRIRQKNKFFQRLSQAGDKVFPRRKELIKDISHLFIEDVNQFIQSHFKEELEHEAVYVLREEIKALQGLAKILTLNTNAFTQTRLRLSECWDKLKVAEKERKKERAQQRAQFRQYAQEIHSEIQQAKDEWTQGQLSVADAQKRIDEISVTMRRTTLDRQDVKVLRDALHEVRQAVQEKVQAEEDAKQRHEQERSRQKKEKYKELKEKAEALVRQYEDYDADQLQAERDALMTEMQQSTFSKNEKQEIERVLKPVRDLITEKREKALLNLSEDDRQSLQQLQQLLQQRRQRRQEIKNQLEVLRKAAGSSSLDFEKAMQYTDQINEEKERLEKVDQGIKEIEDKLAQLQVKKR